MATSLVAFSSSYYYVRLSLASLQSYSKIPRKKDKSGFDFQLLHNLFQNTILKTVAWEVYFPNSHLLDRSQCSCFMGNSFKTECAWPWKENEGATPAFP